MYEEKSLARTNTNMPKSVFDNINKITKGINQIPFEWYHKF